MTTIIMDTLLIASYNRQRPMEFIAVSDHGLSKNNEVNWLEKGVVSLLILVIP